jgi:hypothetical protein
MPTLFPDRESLNSPAKREAKEKPPEMPKLFMDRGLQSAREARSPRKAPGNPRGVCLAKILSFAFPEKRGLLPANKKSPALADR